MSSQQGTGIYWKVFFALLVCTAVTVAQSRMPDLGHVTNIVIGLLIASFKATLVALFFMHLKHEKRYFYPVVIFPLILVLVIIFANFPDTAFGDHCSPATDVGGGHAAAPAETHH